ncbi:MAG TPA: PAS domain S-box protein, partial [Desulfomonilia bacterium]|nr:PAS domain S-box protein [Desulfomonilia bacterium]
DLFDTVTTNMLEGLIVVDWEGNILFANAAAYRFAGLRPRKTTKGLNMYQFLRPDDFKRAFQEQMLARSGKGGFLTQYKIITPRKREKWLEARSQRVSFRGQDVNLVTFRDITGYKNAEERLQLSEKKFSAAFHSCPDPIAITEPRSDLIIDVNKAFETWSGYSRHELVGHSASELKLWGDPFANERIGKALKKTGSVDGTEIQIRIKGGELRDMLFSAKPIKIDKKSYLLSIAHDITARKQAEKALRESEERFRQVFENSGDGIVVISLDDFRIIQANKAMCDMLGYSEGELKKLRLSDITPPDERTIKDEQLLEHVRGDIEHIEFEKTYITKSGGIVWGYLTGRLVLDAEGKPMYGLGVIKNITDRKRDEEFLKESEEKFRLAFENANTGMCLVDLKGRLLKVNNQMHDIFGYSVNELESMTVNDIAYPDDVNTSQDFIQKALSGEAVSASFEKRYIHKQGQVIHTIVSSTLIKDSHGSPLYFISQMQDITMRKRMEEALRESEERYRKIAAAVTDYIYTVHVENGRAVSTEHSAACEAVTGYTVEEFNTNPYLWFTMVHEEDRDRVRGYFENVLKGEHKGHIEHRIYRKGGSVRWVVNMPVVHRDEAGSIISYDGVLSDITERKVAEEALKESEERYRLMAELTGKLVYDYDVPTGRITWHGAIEKVTGYGPEEFNRVDVKAFNELIHPEDRARTIVVLEAAIRKCGPYYAEYRLLSKDGNYIFLEDRGVFLPGASGKAVRMLGSMGDITERKKAEEALKESEKRFRSLIQSSSDIIVILDENGVMTFESPSMEGVLKYPVGSMIGKNPLDYVHPDDIENVARDLAEVYDDANPGSQTEFRFRRADNTWVYLEALGNNLIDYPGINGVVITARDITERKKAEELKLDMERRLLHAQKLESLGVMAGGIAHDFNNLLMAILGNLDLARLDLSPVSRSRPFIDQALVAARRAADLTNQMLAYSGKGRFDLKSFDLSELVQEMAHLLKASISKTVTLNLQMGGNLPSILADPSQIQQIIMNLIVNASEAIGEHPGVVTVTTGTMECDEGCLQKSRLKEKPSPGLFTFIEVSDTGCGMDNETKDRLFDPFFTTKFTGRGLGMAAVLGIVSGHKGVIMVESVPGQGATVRVLFPTSEMVKTAPPDEIPDKKTREAEDEERMPSSGTVLIADDEDMVRDLCKSMIERFGYKVITASDGREALELFRKHASEIVCVILDLTMPVLDGMAAFDELKRIKADVKVILSSGYNEQEATNRFSGKGLAGFIKKPYQLSSLRMELNKVLNNP